MHHNKMFWHYYEASLAHSWARLTKGFAYCEPFFLFQGRKLLAHLAHSIHSTRTFFEHDGLAAPQIYADVNCKKLEQQAPFGFGKLG